MPCVGLLEFLGQFDVAADGFGTGCGDRLPGQHCYQSVPQLLAGHLLSAFAEIDIAVVDAAQVQQLAFG